MSSSRPFPVREMGGNPLAPVFQAAQPIPFQRSSQESTLPRVTIKADDLPLRSLLAQLSSQTGLSMAAAQTLDAATVTGDWINLPLDQVLQTVARRLGVELISDRGLYFLGERNPEDLAIFCRRVMRLEPNEIKQAVGSFLSNAGSLTVTPDGLVIVGDRLQALERLHDLFEAVEKAPSVVWCVQLHVISMSDADLHDFGLDVNPALELALGYANLSNVTRDLVGGAVQGVRGEGGDSSADVSLSAVLRATRTSSTMHLVTDPLFSVVDGSTAEITRGVSLPVRTSTTNAQTGQVSEQVRFVQTGLECKCGVREISPTLARLKLDLKVSDLVENNTSGPTTDNQSLITSADVRTGGVYILGALRRGKDERSKGAFLQWGDKKNQSADCWVIFCKAYRIGQSLDLMEQK